MTLTWWLVPCLPFPGLPHIYFLFTVRLRICFFISYPSLENPSYIMFLYIIPFAWKSIKIACLHKKKTKKTEDIMSKHWCLVLWVNLRKVETKIHYSLYMILNSYYQRRKAEISTWKDRVKEVLISSLT
jgi:hypothetical protein